MMWYPGSIYNMPDQKEDQPFLLLTFSALDYSSSIISEFCPPYKAEMAATCIPKVIQAVQLSGKIFSITSS